MGIVDSDLHAVQYITCDQNCVMIAGLISDNVRKVCKAVMKEVISLGVIVGEVSLKSDCRGAAADPARVRAKLCRKDAKPPCFVADRGPDGDGEGGRLDGEGVCG